MSKKTDRHRSADTESWLRSNDAALGGPRFAAHLLAEPSPRTRKQLAIAGITHRLGAAGSSVGAKILWDTIVDLLAAGYNREEASGIVRKVISNTNLDINLEREIARYHANILLGEPFTAAEPALQNLMLCLIREDERTHSWDFMGSYEETTAVLNEFRTGNVSRAALKRAINKLIK